MAAAGPARSCPPGRFLGLSSGRRRRCCRYCGSGCRLRPPTAPLSPSPSGSPAAPSASIRGRWGSPSAAAPAPGPAGPARPLPVADGLGSSGPKSPFSCLKEPPPSRCDVTSPSNPAGRGRAAGGGAGAGPGRARLRDLQTRDAWAMLSPCSPGPHSAQPPGGQQSPPGLFPHAGWTFASAGVWEASGSWRQTRNRAAASTLCRRAWGPSPSLQAPGTRLQALQEDGLPHWAGAQRQ